MPVVLEYIKKLQRSAVIGLDLQPDAFRLVELERGSGGYTLTRAVEQKLTTRLIDSHGVFQEQLFLRTLTAFVVAHQLNDRAVVIALPITNVDVQHVQLMVGLREEEIMTAVEQRLRQAQSGLTLCADFAVLPTTESGYLDIALAMTQEVRLKSLVNWLETAGLKVKIVDIDVYALVRAVCFNLHWQVPPTQLGAILYYQDKVVWLIGFDTRDILFYQRFATIEIINLQQFLQTALSTYQLDAVQQVVVCGEGELSNASTYKYCADPFAAIQQSARREYTNTQQYWLACGLALRALPVW